MTRYALAARYRVQDPQRLSSEEMHRQPMMTHLLASRPCSPMRLPLCNRTCSSFRFHELPIPFCSCNLSIVPVFDLHTTLRGSYLHSVCQRRLYLLYHPSWVLLAFSMAAAERSVRYLTSLHPTGVFVPWVTDLLDLYDQYLYVFLLIQI
jgi:hypothetical protein